MRSLSIGAIFALCTAAGLTVPTAEAKAQVMATPPGCQWLDAGRGEQDLYCRGEDGQMFRTETHRRDMGGSMDVCLRGQLDDGMGCVSESEARDSQAFGLQYDPSVNAPPPFDWKAAKTSDGKWRDPSRPDGIIVETGRRGHRGYGAGYGTGYIVNVPD